MADRGDERADGVSGRTLPLLVARGISVAVAGAGPNDREALAPALATWGPVLQAALTAVVLGAVGASATELASAQIAGGSLALAGAGGVVAAYFAALGVGSLGAPGLISAGETALTPLGLHEIAPGAWVGRRAGATLSASYVVFDVGEGLVLVATVEAEEPEVSAVRALGEVRWVVAPSPRWAAAAQRWCTVLPQATLCAPRGADVPGAERAASWPEGVLERVDLPITKEHDELCLFHRPSGTLFVADALVYASSTELSRAARWPYRLALMLDRLGPPLGARLGAGWSSDARRAWSVVLRWPAQRLVVGRGPMLSGDVRAALAGAIG